ncbi:MAG: hypothetical protein H7Z43_04985 [Clostridia bacterium]|nr:hypothetical protein [Deltaproteobacteria bacterium]
MTPILFALLLTQTEHPTAGVLMNPLEGESVTAHDRDILPSGHNLNDEADLWFSGMVNQQNGDGGMTAFDPMRLSTHGRSWTLLNHTLNGLSINDIARPGSPVIDLPYTSWDRLTYRSLWSGQPGFDATIDASPENAKLAYVRGSYGAYVGGQELIPAGFMNRDPATAAGATPIRRRVKNSGELEAQTAIAGDIYALRLMYEHRGQTNQYPTLISDTSGKLSGDSMTRDTVMGVGELHIGDVPLRLVAAWQRRDRSNEGAEHRLPNDYTQATDGDAYLAQLSTSRHFLRDAEWTFAIGGSYSDDHASQNSDRSVVSDIEREWLWLSRPQVPEHLTRTSIDFKTGLAFSAASPIAITLTGNQSWIHRNRGHVGDIGATTYERSDIDRSQTMTIYESRNRSEEWLRSLRLEANGRHQFGSFEVRGMLAIDHGAVGVPSDMRLSFWTPAAGIAATRPLGGGHFFTLIRREPDKLTAEVSRFLNPKVDNGNRYAWNDNGDLRPTTNETGRLLARTGGRYHQVADDITRPTSNQFAIGWETPRFGPFRVVMTGTLRFQFDAFLARLNSTTNNSYQQTTLDDPGGDGRGEGDATRSAYNRIPGTEGQELYQLRNRGRDNRFVGAEVQLVSVEGETVDDHRPWFLNLTTAGYWDIGSGAFGSFPDRNDPGIIDEITADPNARVNERGRFDHDRAFSIKALSGWEPIKGLTGSLAVRYRDGQPFVRTVVAEDLQQGATPLMAVWRGAARHTFHLTSDVKVRWHSQVGPVTYAVSAEVYNLFQQSLELVEDSRTGRVFRRALEMMPGRTGFVTLELWL